MRLVGLGLPCGSCSHWQEAEHAMKEQERPRLLPGDESYLIPQSRAVEDV